MSVLPSFPFSFQWCFDFYYRTLEVSKISQWLCLLILFICSHNLSYVRKNSSFWEKQMRGLILQGGQEEPHLLSPLMHTPARLTRSEDIHKKLISWLIRWTKDQVGYIQFLKETLMNYLGVLLIKQQPMPRTGASSLHPNISATQETETPASHELCVFGREFFCKANCIY